MQIAIAILIFLWIIPLGINYVLARNQGENIRSILFRTLAFSWILTVILIFKLPGYIQTKSFGGADSDGRDRIYRKEDYAFLTGFTGLEHLEHLATTSSSNRKVCMNCGRYNRGEDRKCFNCRAPL